MMSILSGTLKPVGAVSITSFTIWRGSYAFLFRHVEQRQEAGLEIRSLIKTKTALARSDAHFRRLFSVISEYLDALDSGRFNYRPGFGCPVAL